MEAIFISSLMERSELFFVFVTNNIDPDPAKAEQYARWHELRKMREENEREGMTVDASRVARR